MKKNFKSREGIHVSPIHNYYNRVFFGNRLDTYVLTLGIIHRNMFVVICWKEDFLKVSSCLNFSVLSPLGEGYIILKLFFFKKCCLLGFIEFAPVYLWMCIFKSILCDFYTVNVLYLAMYFWRSYPSAKSCTSLNVHLFRYN